MYYYILCDENGSNTIELNCLMFPGAEFILDEYRHGYKVIRQQFDENFGIIIFCEQLY